jgi:hypothetical protein
MDTSTIVMIVAAVIALAVIYFKSPEAASKGLNATGSLMLEMLLAWLPRSHWRDCSRRSCRRK